MRDAVISVMFPTRGRPHLLARSITSLLDQAAHSDDVEILLGIDSDDRITLDLLPTLPRNVRGVILPPLGYKGALLEYFNRLAAIATGQWLLVWNDDALMQTYGWDSLIAALPPCVGNLQHNHGATNVFPVVPREWVEILGHFSLNTHIDTWWHLIADWTGTHHQIPALALHDRADMTGNNDDTTYAERIYDQERLWSNDVQGLIARDADIIREWLKANSVKDVLVIVPSRSRPHHVGPFVEALQAHSTRAEVLFALDDDDPALAEYRAVLGITYEINPPLGLVGTLNLVARKYADHYRYLAYFGDDYRIRTPSWDQRLIGKIEDLTAGIAHANDLLYGPSLPAAVLMKADVVRRLGYMVPPELGRRGKNVFWRDVGKALGTLRYDREIVIEHVGPAAGKAPEDAVYQAANAPEAVALDHLAYQSYAQSRLAADVARLMEISYAANSSLPPLHLANVA